MIVRLGLLFSVLGAWLAVTACSSGGGGKLNNDAAVADVFIIDYKFGDLPPGCPPGVANDRGVGAPCTAGGKQCPNQFICTCDVTLGVTPPEGTPCFCTLPAFAPCTSVPAGYCGTGASCCSYMGQASICVPDVCLDSAMCPVF